MSAGEIEEAGDSAESSGRRMSDAEFAEAREAYELGTETLGDLAERYGVSRQALSKRFKAAGVKKGSRAHEIAAAAGAAAKTATATAAATAERFADKRAEWIEETRLEAVSSLRQVRLIARKVVSDALKSGAPVASAEDDLKAVQRFNKILCDNLQITLGILKADEHVDEDDLPSLRIEDLTPEEILQHHKNTGALPEDATVEEMLAETIDLGDLNDG